MKVASCYAKRLHCPVPSAMCAQVYRCVHAHAQASMYGFIVTTKLAAATVLIFPAPQKNMLTAREKQWETYYAGHDLMEYGVMKCCIKNLLDSIILEMEEPRFAEIIAD